MRLETLKIALPKTQIFLLHTFKNLTQVILKQFLYRTWQGGVFDGDSRFNFLVLH